MEGELAFELCDPLGLLGDLFAELFILLLQSLNLFRLVGQRLLITRSSVRRPLWPPPRHPGYDSDSRGFCPAPVNWYLAAAHARGITHRDLKPQNIMLGGDGRVKVLDFGLAKVARMPTGDETPTDDATMLQTQQGLAVGTVPYMSPEQLEGSTVDPRSDIFSLGVLFYEMATGRRPFHGDSALALATAILRDDPTPVAALVPDFPDALVAIVQQCLAKEPAARYQNGERLHRALGDVRPTRRPTGTTTGV